MLALLVMMSAPLSDWRLQIRQAPPWIQLIAAHCAGDAWASRGNHATGTDNVRPSVRATRNSSSEHSTAMARGASLRIKEFIPCLLKRLLMGFGQSRSLHHVHRILHMKWLTGIQANKSSLRAGAAQSVPLRIVECRPTNL
jgi:hypothetical protein